MCLSFNEKKKIVKYLFLEKDLKSFLLYKYIVHFYITLKEVQLNIQLNKCFYLINSQECIYE